MWRSCICLKTGDSSTALRMRWPTTISTIEKRNGMRQPQARKASLPSTVVSSQTVKVARIMPQGTPICGKAPKNPRLLVGACSTDISAAPPHSPPAEKPCRTRSRISRIGASTPIWA